MMRIHLASWLASATLLIATSSDAAIIPFSTTLSSDYFIISTNGTGGDATDGQQSVEVSNFEIGANKAPVPSTDSFLTGGSSGGPTLLGAVPNLPGSGITLVEQGIGGHANVAVTNPQDEFGIDNAGVYADPEIGIRVANSSVSSNTNQSGDSFFNDPNSYPNTFTPTGPTGTGGNLGGTGAYVGPGAAVQSTRIDFNNNAGVTYNFDHTDLTDELVDARTTISGLGTTNVLKVSNGNAGELENSSTITGAGGATISFGGANSIGGVSATITLATGLNVIDIATDGNGSGNDFSINNANLVIDGPVGSSVIFRLLGDDNLNLSNSNILLGDSGIGRNNVLFYTDQSENDTHFDFSNTILNGAAFWSLGNNGGEISVDNGQGSTQFIADKISLQDVRFTRWGFAPIPEPSSVALLGGGALLFFTFCRRRTT